jgi:U3 small nucleolar RNA-associated protein 13
VSVLTWLILLVSGLTRSLDQSSSSLVSVHADQNIIYHSLSTAQTSRQIIGFNDEIIDATFLTHPSSSSSSHTHLALATNSAELRLYSTSSFDARLLSGHKDMILCLDKSPDYSILVTGAKDMTARIWAPDFEGHWRCVAICEGHAESVGAVAFSRKVDEKTGRPKFLVTASQDRTLKLWDHEKDINSLDISPNDRFVASGSQDKLVKIFELEYSNTSSSPAGSLRLAGVCKGHRRGVWSVKFSRNDKIVASGAADKSVRLWSLDDFTCLKVSLIPRLSLS